ncbi:MAG: hypothetical protein GX556_20610, partial [Fibrobacter sp.]|nr:hypothetical protein [Fibrobacter sp.]
MRAFSFKIYCLIALILLYAGAAIGDNYFWDTSTGEGYQSGSGTWGGGTYNYWTRLGGYLISWPGAGNSATFTSGGTSVITVDGTQAVDSMAFLSNGYTLSSGTINYGSKNGLLVASGVTATINSVIAGTGGLKIYANSTTEAYPYLNGANTYTGVTTISRYIRLNVSSVANGGQNSSIGKSSSSAANLVFDGGILRHTGGAASTDRLFTLTEKGGFIYASGSGALNFTNTGAIAFSGTGARSLEFGGASAVSNSFSPVIGNGTDGSTAVKQTGVTGSSWTFTGDNTYSGGTTISSGTLQIGDGGTTGSITGNVTNNGTLVFKRSNAYTFEGVISGSGVVKQSGTGTTSLSGTNTYSGGTTISSGTLQIGNGGTTGSITGNVTNNGTLTLNRANDYSFTGTISGTGAVTQNGAAVLTFSGASHTYSGTTTINGGTLAIGDGGSIYSSGTYAGTVVINDGGVFRMNRFDFWGGHTSKPSAMIMINEGGAMISNGYNNTLGPITLNGGSLVSDGGSQWGWDTWSLHGTVTVNGTVKSNITTTGGAYNEVKIGDCTEGGQTTFDVGNNAEGDDLEVSSVLRDDRGSSDPYPAVSSGLIKTGAGTMLLTGTNTYSGGTTISAGTLQIGNSGTTGSITGNVTDNATLVFKRSDAYTFGGVISGSGAVIQAGAGTLTLSGANTYSGLTTVNSVCTLIVAHNTALGNTTGGTSLSAGGIGHNRATALVISNGITVTGETVTLNSNITEDHRSALVVKNGSTATWNGTVTLAGDGSAQFYADGTMDLQGTINGSCASLYIRGNESTGIGNLNATVNIGSTKLLKTGEDGTWIINSTGNTWGSTQVAAGTLKLGVSNALPSATVVTIGENSTLNSTLDLNAKDQTIAGLTDGGSTGGTQKITNSGASPSTLTINNTSDYTYSYLIEDGTDKVNLVKSGTGTLTLAGTNTYTGTTNVSGGTLAVNGSTHSSSAVSVFAGATLAGSGTAAGSVTVANDGIIAPGNSAGTLSTGSLVLDNSSVLDFELGTSSDLIEVSGDLTLDGILNITETAGFGLGDYTIINYTGVLTDNDLDIGTAPDNFIYEISINEGTKSVILTVLPGTKLNPVTVVQSAAVCSVYTDDWTIVFDNGAGGGITAMTDSVHGQSSSGQGNQIGAGQNLYYFSYGG